MPRLVIALVLFTLGFLAGRYSVVHPVTPTPVPVFAGGVVPAEVQSVGAGVLPDLTAFDRRTVTRVVDGDTLVLDGDERVRLIGVDTPETVHPSRPVEHYGKEASEFTRRMVEGQDVYLEYGHERSDRYGRTLGYVHLEDGTLLNREIIAQGYGHAYTRFPFDRMDEFRAAEAHARENQLGLWAPAEVSVGEDRPEPSYSAPPIAQDPWPQQAQRSCTPRNQCCKVCSRGKACGDTCISRSYTCRKGRGCACNAVEVCR